MSRLTITHVKQEHPKGCSLASAAMLAGLTWDEALKWYHEWRLDEKAEPIMGAHEVKDFLQFLGCTVTIPYTPSLINGNIYEVTVPSLRIPRAMHSIVIDAREDCYEDWTIYDPQRGNVPDDPLCLYGPKWDLISWGYLVRLVHRPRKPIPPFDEWAKED